jgi:hypothetical protein
LNVAVALRPASLYIARIGDERYGEAFGDHAYLDATVKVLQENGGLQFYGESYMV